MVAMKKNRIWKSVSALLLALVMCVTQIQPAVLAAGSSAGSSSNLAQGKAVTYSGVEGDKNSSGEWTYPQFVGEMAVDGDSSTRWSAAKQDEQWLIVDLGAVYELSTITIDFHAESPEYEILVSEDGTDYTSVAKVTDGSQGDTVTKSFDVSGASARYIQYQQHSMWLHSGNGQYYGSSISEITVTEHKDYEITPDTLRVGTFNIAANKKPDMDELSALTEKYNLEVVGLQEVDMFTSRNDYDMLKAFQGDTYPAGYFSKAIDYGGGEYGIGTVSKYEFTENSYENLDTTGAGEGSENRVFQRSVFEKEGREVAFYNTHFSYENPEVRVKQFAQLKEALENDDVEYKIVVGDFNADQYQSEFNTMLESLDMANGYQGVWYETYNGVDETMKVNTIDNIFVTRNLSIESVEMDETELSDHNLFMAELKFLDEPQVSTEWLRAVLEEADSINGDDYTAESYEALRNAVEAGRAMMENPTGQTAVDDAAREVLAAIDNLEEFNLAAGKNVTYSGVEGDKNSDGSWVYPQFVGEMAVDGSQDTRWSAAKTDEQWLQVDLGEVKEISQILIYFHAASPEWEVQISEDGEKWTTVYEETDGEEGGPTITEQITFPMQNARYVRYQQNKMWLHATNGRYYGSSIIELEVYHSFAAESIEITNPTDAISVGDTYQLDVKVLPELAGNNPLTYTSSAPDVISVDDEGTLEALKEGAAVIAVADQADPDVKASMEIQAVDGEITVSKFVFDEESKDITSRESRFLEYSVYPSNAVNPDVEVEWSSSDPDVAAVNEDGLVKAVSEGSAVITVQSKDDADVKGSVQINVAAPSYNTEYDTMMDRWQTRVTGGDSLDMEDEDVKAYVQTISDEGEELWASLNKSEDRTYLWEKVASDTTSADYTTQFTKIKSLALAFGVQGSALYENKELLNDIVDAIQFMVTDKQYNGSYWTGNWWDWQIGCTQPLVDTLMVISDYVDYSEIEATVKSIEGYAKRPSIQWPSYTATGANRTDIGLSVLGSAILAKNDERMNLVKTEVPDVMKLVTSGDGLYADGSVVQHTKHAYSGSYGNELLKGVGRIQSIIAGTSFDITDERINNVYETVINGYIPLMHKGQMMSMVNGRSISRAPGTNPFTTEFAAGSETISNIMLLAAGAPEEYSSAFKSAVKYWLEESSGEYDFYANARDFDALLGAKEIMNDSSVTAEKYEGMKVYGSMDRVVQVNEDYTAGLSMYSSRIYNYEFGNTENKKGWHTGDGVLYIYNNDLKQYGEGYWPTVDPYRLPGTTVDTKELADGSGYNKTSPQSWVGGATDGTNGAAGMFYNTTNLGQGMDLKAQKSWFFLDGKIVALGAGINGTTDATIETTVENRMMTSDENAISYNGEAWDKDNEELRAEAGDYVHFTGTGEGNDIGYVYLEDADIYLAQETRSGKYSDINEYFVSDTEYTNTFFKMGINHGDSVEDGTYEYVLLPGSTEEETAEFARNNTIEVVRNDADVQAVKDTESGVFAMNVWPVDGASVNGITVNASASVYTQTADGVMTIAISEPKQQDVQLQLTLEDGYVEVISADEGVTVNEDGSFSIDTTDSAGASYIIKVKTSADSVSKKTLEFFLNKAKGYVEDGTVGGLVESIQKMFEDAIAKGEAVMADEDATREEVLDAAADLMFAIHALEMKAADKTDLEMALELAEMIDLTKYVEAGQPEFLAAKEAAEAVMANGDAMQAETDEAWNDLVEAMNALRLKADKSVLEDLINQTEDLDLTGYTEESVSVFRAALAAANDILADETLSADDQTKVNEAVSALQAAVDGLEKPQGGQGGDAENPSGGQNGNDGQAAGGNTGDGTGAGDNNGSGSGNGKAPAAVQTGDSAIMLYVFLAAGAASLAVLGAALYARKKVLN